MVTTGAQRTPPADTNCPPAAQRNQAKRACYNNLSYYTLPVQKYSYTAKFTIQIVIILSYLASQGHLICKR